jgi:hypothetical protein
MLKFTEGMQFDTQTTLHKEQRSDGWYLVGNGMLIPVKDEAEADLLLDRMKVPVKDVFKN